MLKLVLNVKYWLLLSFLTASEFYNLGHIKGNVWVKKVNHYCNLSCLFWLRRYYKGALTQKRLFFSALYYFQIWFSCQLKKSKQTFNTKFVIWHTVKMTWTGNWKKMFILWLIKNFTTLSWVKSVTNEGN